MLRFIETIEFSMLLDYYLFTQTPHKWSYYLDRTLKYLYSGSMLELHKCNAKCKGIEVHYLPTCNEGAIHLIVLAQHKPISFHYNCSMLVSAWKTSGFD